jgi:DNA-binding response OmpR family regulator
MSEPTGPVRSIVARPESGLRPATRYLAERVLRELEEPEEEVRVLVGAGVAWLRDVVAARLAECGRFRCDTAATRDEVLSMTASTSYGCVVVDALGPQDPFYDVDGVEVIRALRLHGVTTPIVSLVAAYVGDVRHRALEAGATAVLEWSTMQPDYLRRFLRTVLRGQPTTSSGA